MSSPMLPVVSTAKARVTAPSYANSRLNFAAPISRSIFLSTSPGDEADRLTRRPLVAAKRRLHKKLQCSVQIAHTKQKTWSYLRRFAKLYKISWYTTSAQIAKACILQNLAVIFGFHKDVVFHILRVNEIAMKGNCWLKSFVEYNQSALETLLLASWNIP